ncbi:hypothetical protein XPA_010510 [Xanthoria parietina]
MDQASVLHAAAKGNLSTDLFPADQWELSGIDRIGFEKRPDPKASQRAYGLKKILVRVQSLECFRSVVYDKAWTCLVDGQVSISRYSMTRKSAGITSPPSNNDESSWDAVVCTASGIVFGN